MRSPHRLATESAAVPAVGVTARLAWTLPLVQSVLDAKWVTPLGHRYPLWLAVGALVGAWLMACLASRHPRLRALPVALGVAVTIFAIVLCSRVDIWSVLAWAQSVVDGSAARPASLPSSVVFGLATALLWREGLRVDWRNSEALWRSFRGGILIISGLAILHGISPGQLPDYIPVGMLALVTSGLAGLALLSATGRGGFAPSRQEPQRRVRHSWLAATVGVVSVIVAAGWVLGAVLSPTTVRRLAGLMRPALGFLGRLVQLVLLGLAYVAFWLLSPLLQALLSAGEGRELQMDSLNSTLGRDLAEQAQEAWNMPPLIRALLLGAGLAALLTLLAVAFWRAWGGRRDASRTAALAEERQSLWSIDILRQQLTSLFRHSGQALPSFVPLGDGEDPRLTVRRIYQQLLAVAADNGQVRSPGSTPVAFGQLLSSLLPSQCQEIDALTALYVEARYADGAIGPEAAAAAERAWSALAAELPRLGEGRPPS